MKTFDPKGLPALIGSLPMADHAAATELVFEYVPEIPLWVQLPIYREEGMVAQFLPGMPGVVTEGDRTFIDKESAAYAEEVLGFYEEYLSVSEGGGGIEESRFSMTGPEARGFDALLRKVSEMTDKPAALKGQITGPITFATGVTDREGRAVFYDDELKDVAIKHLSMKAAWQARKLSGFGVPAVVFFDEPALAGFGSSAFLTITKDAVKEALNEMSRFVHAEGALSGVHVCANTEWDLLLESDLDVISFDAYSYFDKFMLYGSKIKSFIERGGILAVGIVPTTPAETIVRESTDSLFTLWESQLGSLEGLGLARGNVIERILVTPSCGTGSLPFELAVKVLEMTRDLSKKIREI
jgi:methionine synthase II (cobalamin-independent)